MSGHAIRWILLLGCCIWLAASSAPAEAEAEAEAERVQLIMSKLPAQHSAAYRAIRRLAGSAARQILPLTKCEMWSVPRKNVDAVKIVAAQHGVGVKILGEDWNHLFRSPPAHMTMDEKQKALLQRLTASEATSSVHIVAVPAPGVVEYALTRNTSSAASAKVPKIELRLSNQVLLAVRRTSVKRRTNKWIWTGRVEGTGAPVTLFWWPSGRMAGTIRHRGRIYSIRYMGGDVHAIVDMKASRMPPMHSPVPQRRRADYFNRA
jgi:hypothetical protein